MHHVNAEGKTTVVPHQLGSINTGHPDHSAEGAGWYILRCGAGTEVAAEKSLQDLGWNVFLPRELKWRVVLWRRKAAQLESEYPRFPGYLFLATTPLCWPPFDEWPLQNYIRGILGIAGRPVPLASGEIERLRAEDGRPVPHTTSVPLHRAFAVGDDVRVLAGPFRDWIVHLDAIDGQGGHFDIEVLGRRTRKVLPLTWLEAA